MNNLIITKPILNDRIETDNNEEVIDILRLIKSENVGPKTFWNLIKLFGTAKNALENLQDFSLRGGKTKAVNIFSYEEACQELELLHKYKANIISYKSPIFSKLLLEIVDCPPILSYMGNINLLSYEQSIAVVGARNASVNGRAFATKITRDLIDRGFIVVSGLAKGIDASVHQVNYAKTIGVIAGGIDHIYPAENTKIYEQIADNGLIIAELSIGSKPLARHFPRRNRLISALTIATVVIEASLKSGSLITARFALEQNREVFAVPGFPLDPRCQGTNKLIKEGAGMVESINDIVDNLPLFSTKFKRPVDNIENYTTNTQNNVFNSQINHDNLVTNSMRKQIKDLLSSTPINFDCLQHETQLPLQIIHMVLLELELAGKIARYPGNKISLIYE